MYQKYFTRYKRQSNNAGQYHYHANINCTDAGAATGANNPDTCKLIGENQCRELLKCIMYSNTLIGYYRDGVPVYGFCKDSSGAMFTSCYKLNSGSSTTTVVTVSGTYTVASSNSDYTFSADSNCNLDEANGLFVCFSKIIEKQAQLQVLFIQPQASTLTS